MEKHRKVSDYINAIFCGRLVVLMCNQRVTTLYVFARYSEETFQICPSVETWRSGQQRGEFGH